MSFRVGHCTLTTDNVPLLFEMARSSIDDIQCVLQLKRARHTAELIVEVNPYKDIAFTYPAFIAARKICRDLAKELVKACYQETALRKHLTEVTGLAYKTFVEGWILPSSLYDVARESIAANTKAYICGYPYQSTYSVKFAMITPDDGWYLQCAASLSRIITLRRAMRRRTYIPYSSPTNGVVQYGFSDLSDRALFSFTGKADDAITGYLFYERIQCKQSQNQAVLASIGVTLREASDLDVTLGAVRAYVKHVCHGWDVQFQVSDDGTLDVDAQSNAVRETLAAAPWLGLLNEYDA